MIAWQPISPSVPTRLLMAAKHDDRDKGSGPPRYDAPGWIKGAIAVLASAVWGFTVVESVSHGRTVDALVHVVFIGVIGAVFGIDVRRWNR